MTTPLPSLRTPLSFTNHDLQSRPPVPVRSSPAPSSASRAHHFARQLCLFVFAPSNPVSVDRCCTTEALCQALGFLDSAIPFYLFNFNCNSNVSFVSDRHDVEDINQVDQMEPLSSLAHSRMFHSRRIPYLWVAGCHRSMPLACQTLPSRMPQDDGDADSFPSPET